MADPVTVWCVVRSRGGVALAETTRRTEVNAMRAFLGLDGQSIKDDAVRHQWRIERCTRGYTVRRYHLVPVDAAPSPERGDGA